MLFLLNAFFALFFTCSVPSQKTTINIQKPLVFSPQGSSSITLTTTEVSSNTATASAQAFPPLREQLPNGANVFLVLEANLNNDQFEEQIVAYKLGEDPNEEILILVYSSDIRYEEVLFTWRTRTKASELRSFVIRLEDLDADNMLEIVSTGINAQGNHTLDVYKIQDRLETLGVSFQSILSIESPLGIDIRQFSPQTNASFSQTYTNFVQYEPSKAEDAHPLDRLENIYTWKPTISQYTLETVNFINGEEEALLEHGALSGYDSDDLTKLLSGLWGSEEGYMLYYDPEINQLALSKNDIQEWYTVITDYKTIRNTYPSVRMTMRNDLLLAVQSDLYVSFVGRDVIDIVSDSENELSSVYKRIEEQEIPLEFKNLVLSQDKESANFLQEFVGTFTNNLGDELYLDGESFIFTREGVITKGTYSIYDFSYTILEMTHVDSEKATPQGSTFALSFANRNNKNILEMVPVTLEARGISFFGESPIVLEQLE